MRRLLVPLALLLALAAVPAAQSAETRTPITALPNESDVRAYGGQLLISRYVATTKRYELVLIGRDGSPTVLPAAPQTRPFDADIGPGPDGRPTVVYSACGGTKATEDDCDLWRLKLDGTPPRPIAAANTPEQPETAPTVWRSRIAFARGTTNPIVYTRGLDAARAKPSRRQAGVPTRTCDDLFEGPRNRADCTTKGREVRELELFGDLLGQVVGYYVDGQGGHGNVEVRLADVARGGARRVATQTYGEGGQFLLGVSFAAGRLGWTKSCFGDPGGCSNHGPYRYRYRSNRYERAGGGYVPMAGFTLVPGGYAADRGASIELGEGPTTLQRVTGTTWRPMAAHRVRGG